MQCEIAMLLHQTCIRRFSNQNGVSAKTKMPRDFLKEPRQVFEKVYQSTEKLPAKEGTLFWWMIPLTRRKRSRSLLEIPCFCGGIRQWRIESRTRRVFSVCSSCKGFTRRTSRATS